METYKIITNMCFSRKLNIYYWVDYTALFKYYEQQNKVRLLKIKYSNFHTEEIIRKILKIIKFASSLLDFECFQRVLFLKPRFTSLSSAISFNITNILRGKAAFMLLKFFFGKPLKSMIK
jgi:hypothetical protein